MNSIPVKTLPKLYSFRRCPYAMRARLSLALANIRVDIIEVDLANKPAELWALSAKGTVPVMQLPDGSVIDESLDIMLWASQNTVAELPFDPTDELIVLNDNEFKTCLDKYKYFERYPELSQKQYLKLCLPFIDKLENRLEKSAFLIGDSFNLLDLAIMPFIRQFSKVDELWFQNSQYKCLNRWLNFWLAHELFTLIMQKKGSGSI